MPKKNNNNTSSLSFLEGKLKAGKESQKRIELLLDAWRAEIYYETICRNANAALGLQFQTTGAIQDFVVKKGRVDKAYGLQHVFGEYKDEHKQRYDADRILKQAKDSLEKNTETSAPEAKHGSVFLKKVVDELEEAAYKDQIDNQQIAALVIKVDTLHKAVFGKKDDLACADKDVYLMELAQYIKEKKAEDEAREEERREKKANTVFNRLRRSFKKTPKKPNKSQSKESETKEAGTEKNGSMGFIKGLGNSFRRSKQKTHKPQSNAVPLETIQSLYLAAMVMDAESTKRKRLVTQYNAEYSKLSENEKQQLDVWAEAQAAEFSVSNQGEQKGLGARVQTSAVGDSRFVDRPPAAVHTVEASLNAWGDAAASYQEPESSSVERVLSLYEKAMREQRYSIQTTLEEQYNAAFDELSQEKQVEFCSRLDSLHIQVSADAGRPIQPKPSTSSGPLNALQATKDLFTEAYEELNPTKNQALQARYINAYDQLSGGEQAAFDTWAEFFTPTLQEPTDFNRESNARYESWGTNRSTFFSSPSAAGSEPRYDAAQNRAMP